MAGSVSLLLVDSSMEVGVVPAVTGFSLAAGVAGSEAGASPVQEEMRNVVIVIVTMSNGIFLFINHSPELITLILFYCEKTIIQRNRVLKVFRNSRNDSACNDIISQDKLNSRIENSAFIEISSGE